MAENMHTAREGGSGRQNGEEREPLTPIYVAHCAAQPGLRLNPIYFLHYLFRYKYSDRQQNKLDIGKPHGVPVGNSADHGTPWESHGCGLTDLGLDSNQFIYYKSVELRSP
jgi:hypothetical protein